MKGYWSNSGHEIGSISCILPPYYPNILENPYIREFDNPIWTDMNVDYPKTTPDGQCVIKTFTTLAEWIDDYTVEAVVLPDRTIDSQQKKYRWKYSFNVIATLNTDIPTVGVRPGDIPIDWYSNYINNFYTQDSTSTKKLHGIYAGSGSKVNMLTQKQPKFPIYSYMKMQCPSHWSKEWSDIFPGEGFPELFEKFRFYQEYGLPAISYSYGADDITKPSVITGRKLNIPAGKVYLSTTISDNYWSHGVFFSYNQQVILSIPRTVTALCVCEYLGEIQ